MFQQIETYDFYVSATSLHVFAETEPEPSFISKEGVHQAMLGQTIDLPCEVANLGTVYFLV